MTAAVTAAAVAGFGFGALAGPAAGAGETTRPRATTAGQPQGQAQDVPVKVVVLFSSGVGPFEHFGTVRGDGSTELRFKTQQINDILKSLVQGPRRRDLPSQPRWTLTSKAQPSPSCSTSSAESRST